MRLHYEVGRPNDVFQGACLLLSLLFDLLPKDASWIGDNGYHCPEPPEIQWCTGGLPSTTVLVQGSRLHAPQWASGVLSVVASSHLVARYRSFARPSPTKAWLHYLKKDIPYIYLYLYFPSSRESHTTRSSINYVLSKTRHFISTHTSSRTFGYLIIS